MNAFPTAFDPWLRRVRRRLVWRTALIGAALGCVAAAVVAAALWWGGHPEHRIAAAVLVAIAAALGGAVAMRRRWSALDVALYLDARLGTQELVGTAVADDAAPREVVTRAAAALSSADPHRVLPRVSTRAQWAAPIGLLMLGGVLALDPRAPTKAPAEPGADEVRAASVDGLHAAERLDALDGPDPATRELLARAADRARALRAELAQGMERRRALADLATIRDDIQSARIDTQSASGEAGRRAAARALREVPALRAAAEALGRGDLVELDARMQEAANAAESEARDAARSALEEARERATRAGASELAASLQRAQKDFEQRVRDAARLRELADALGDHLDARGREALRQLAQSGSLKAQADLVDALERALEGLSEAERRALAERLAERAGGTDTDRLLTAEELRQLASRLRSAEGRQRLAETLRRLARAQPSADAQRERALGRAEKGARDAERQLGAVPLPDNGPSSGAKGAKGGDEAQPGGVPGGPGGGPAPKTPGSSDDIEGEELRAQVAGDIDPGAPTRFVGPGRAPSRSPSPGDSADSVTPLEPVRADELRGVDHAELPDAYREQVRRYFTP
jgi:hypothetical protein